MIVLQCSNITKSYGAETILDSVKLEIKSNERVALVGRNGAGKSTLLKIMAGKLSNDSGEIITPKGLRLGYLDQHSGLQSDRSIWDEMLTVFTEVKKMEQNLRQLEEKMADPSVYSDETAYEKILAEYDVLQHSFREKGGYQYEADIRSVLSGLKFGNFDYDTSIASLSGGQKTRLALGKLLLSKPELLILDEPTNHLDIDTLGWLENYLSNYNGAVLIVSHDRYFLDKIVSKVYEVARTKASVFHGNYSSYLEEKANRYEQDLKAFEKQQKEVKELEDFIQRNIVRASTSKRAQSRRKKLEKMELMDKPQGAQKSANFSFDIERQSGNEVLNISDLSVSYKDEPPIITNMNLDVKKQESIALIGPNGIGKSTLLKTIAGKIAALHGNIQFGSKVTVGYYDQEQADLHSNKDVLHELWDDYPLTPEKEIRTVLGNFLFSGDDVYKHVSELSGGEKSRLALAKLMMKKANFLIFDEPTNHLDLDSKEVLESALLDYPGTLLFVSHDRYFLNRMATKIVELTEDGLQEYLGDYDYYLMKKDEEQQRQQLRAEREAKSGKDKLYSNEGQDKEAFIQDKEAKKEARKRKREIDKIEQEIEQLEASIEALEEEMLKPEVYESHEKAGEIQQQISDVKTSLDEKMNRWEVLQLEEA
ncbi:ABC-F family ATP-binding cassette domain-containing protein [Alteribacillus bidgolensis]|uniref:ATP-binding cassette, subfamily F, member 3 n=1 Tax=Alteribacillus bidgolensis TaxID=930129 RepID=A0A1G8K147_9BACI|nr:ATP-binding cassette domain-containing protein [Alteribacillus bidgolensis]SDI37099.1 ATP-binding cassette, subfamily F, member 3 [Alteribacillus bidgolensis]